MRVFIDGAEGTTGLRIRERLAARGDVTLLTLPEALRKDAAARAECLRSADAAFLCLPDAAAREAAALAEGAGAGANTVLIDASTAHRTAAGWAYGFAELSPEHRRAIETGDRISVPGCHASGFNALVAPLVARGILDAGAPLACFSLTGYSGGGKKMIAAYEAAERPETYASPRPYGLSQAHKHLPEMKAACGLSAPPTFVPVVGDFYAGMLVTVPVPAAYLRKRRGVAALREALAEHYAGQKLVRVLGEDGAPAAEGGFLAANAWAGRDDMAILVTGCDDRPVLNAVFDNLGKGASGAAIQCMNIRFGLNETTGLNVGA